MPRSTALKSLASKAAKSVLKPTFKAVAASAEPPSVGATLAALRQQHGWSMDELSRTSGVSKSMLSQIERDQANPTVAVVWRLANALGVPLEDLISGSPKGQVPPIALVPAHQTPALRSPDGKCELRILGPIELAGHFEWYELTVQPGGALRSEAHEPGSREHLSVLSGNLQVTSADQAQSAAAGQTVRYAADVEHAISNTSKAVATALLVVIHPA